MNCPAEVKAVAEVKAEAEAKVRVKVRVKVKELGSSLILGAHRELEVFGVRALAGIVAI